MPDHDEISFRNDVLQVEHLPRVERAFFTPIEARYRYPLYYSTSILFAFLLVGTVIFCAVIIGFHWATFLLLILWLLAYLGALYFAVLRVEYMSYAVREQDVSFKRGVWFKDWITIPFNRIQHCELSKGVFDRMFKLASVKIYTAGGTGSDIHIPGLDQEDALRLRDFIIAQIQHVDEEE